MEKDIEDVSTPCYYGICGGYMYGAAPSLNSTFFYYDSDNSELKLDMIATPATTAPGSEQSVSVRVTDKNGQPVANAVVNLVAVDEALSGMGAINPPTILSSVYRSVGNGLLLYSSSHDPVVPNQNGGGAEMGGGGGGDGTDFKDTPLFSSTLTDGDGRATAAFKLPDNITTLAIIRSGHYNGFASWTSKAKSSVVATKPLLFVQHFAHLIFLLTNRLFRLSVLVQHFLVRNLCKFLWELWKVKMKLKRTLSGPVQKEIFEFPCLVKVHLLRD